MYAASARPFVPSPAGAPHPRGLVPTLEVERQAVIEAQLGAAARTTLEWAVARIRAEHLEKQSQHIRDALLRAGGPDLRPSADRVTLVDLVTREAWTTETRWSRTHFLPIMASALRRELRRFLELYLSRHERGKFARMIVITTGSRCEVSELRKRLEALHRRVSREVAGVLNVYDIDLIWRSSELTREQPGPLLAPTYHPHAHLLVIPRRYIAPAKWEELLRNLHSASGGAWIRDTGRLKDVSEAVKYVMKGSDLVAAADGDGSELLELYRALEGLHLCQPSGALRDYIRRFRAKGLVPARMGANLVVTERGRRRRPEPGPDPKTDSPPPNTLLAVTLPQCRSTPWAAPVAVVENFIPGWAWRPGSELLQLHEKCVNKWEAKAGRPPEAALTEASVALAAVRDLVKAGASLDDIASARVVPLIFNTHTTNVGHDPTESVATGPPSAGTGPPDQENDPDSWHF